MRSRRDCLRWIGALPFALGAYGTSACSSPSDEEGSRSEDAVRDGALDVVIVGAGLAGLRAAQVLRAARKRVEAGCWIAMEPMRAFGAEKGEPFR